MPTTSMRPAAGEYAPYYQRYLDRVPEGDLIGHLRRQGAEARGLLAPLDDARALYRYAPGKWSVKEVVGHMNDAERVFAYRALRMGRADTTPLAGFDEKAYTPAGRFDARPLAEIVREYEAVRAASLALFGGMDGEALLRRGTANGNEISVRALAWIAAGHELHHRKLLTERYGVGK